MENVLEANYGNFDEDVKSSDIPVAVYFYSDDCPQCMAFSPVYGRLSEKYNGFVKFVRYFRQQNRNLAETLQIKSSPTVLFYKNGKEVCSRLTGYITSTEFRNSIETVIEGYCPVKPKEKAKADVLILGAGPAGMTAAIYASRARLVTIMIDEGMPGGQAATTFHVANYPGTNGVVRGYDLMENMKRQAESFGTRIDDLIEIINIDFSGDYKLVSTESVDYYAKTIIIATGATPKKLPAVGENEYRGKGVHYCATCDGAMYQDADVLVVGGGESAVEESIFLTRYVKNVRVINRSSRFTASKGSENELIKNPNIEVMWNTEIKEIKGDNFLESVIIEDKITKEKKEIETEGVFVYIGMEPKTSLFKDKLKLSDDGYIIANENMETSVPGVYAAGDVIMKKIRQISTAVGDGTVAGINVEKYINRK